MEWKAALISTVRMILGIVVIANILKEVQTSAPLDREAKLDMTTKLHRSGTKCMITNLFSFTAVGCSLIPHTTHIRDSATGAGESLIHGIVRVFKLPHDSPKQSHRSQCCASSS